MSVSINKILQEYNETIALNKAESNQKFLIFSTERHKIFGKSNLVGGFADRLKGLTTAFYLSVIAKRRFVIDWETPFPIENNLRGHKYDWRFVNARKFVYAANVIRHIDLVDKSNLLDDINWRSIEENLLKNDQCCVLNINSMKLDFMCQYLNDHGATPAKPYELFRAGFNFLFRFVDIPAFNPSKKQFAKLKEDTDIVVGVHLRTGSGNGWRDPVMDDWRNYERALERAFILVKEKGFKNPGFYFVSDSIEARNAVNKKSWPHPVLVDIEDVSHMDRSQASERRSNDLAFHEFNLLRSCDAVVSGQGGFAKMAAVSANIMQIQYDQ